MLPVDFSTVPAFYLRYINHVRDLELSHALSYSMEKHKEVMTKVPEEQGEFRYERGKWSIKELLCHMMDAERIFCYRALRFARNDSTPLPGFEENDYAPEANAHGRTIATLVQEQDRLRASTIDLFNSFTPIMFLREGSANNIALKCIHLGYITAGHQLHHIDVLLERYLK